MRPRSGATLGEAGNPQGSGGRRLTVCGVLVNPLRYDRIFATLRERVLNGCAAAGRPRGRAGRRATAGPAVTMHGRTASLCRSVVVAVGAGEIEPFGAHDSARGLHGIIYTVAFQPGQATGPGAGNDVNGAMVVAHLAVDTQRGHVLEQRGARPRATLHRPGIGRDGGPL